MVKFASIEEQAALRHGGFDALRSMVQAPVPAEVIRQIPDDRWLAALSKTVFQVGFNWEQMEKRWPAFEEAFSEFDLHTCAYLSDEQLETKMATGKLVKHWPKMRSIPLNAAFLLTLSEQAGSLGCYFSTRDPKAFGSEILALQKGGNRMGGKTAALWLRRMGVDSLILTPSVERTLKEFGVVERVPSSKKGWTEFQPIINAWLDETGESLNYLSQVMARATGEIYAAE